MALRVQNLSKSWPGGVQAVADVSLDVGARELVVLFGPSGCGKTTLLRLLAGLEGADAGRIELAERDITRLAPSERNVALVFQENALHPARSAFENIAFPLRVAGVSRAQIETRVRAMAERLGIAAFLGVRPGQLSGGQRQRVALARAMIRQPALFLFDEPLASLDVPARRELRRLIRLLLREQSAPALYVTHDPEEAFALADRLAVLHAGRLLQVGPPLDVYHRPSNRAVAALAGSPPFNFLPGGRRLIRPDCSVSEAPADAVLAVRPSAFQRNGSGEVQIAGVVELVEALGEWCDVVIRLEDGARVTARLTQASEQEQITVAAPLSACLWYHPGTEGALLPNSAMRSRGTRS